MKTQSKEIKEDPEEKMNIYQALWLCGPGHGLIAFVDDGAFVSRVEPVCAGDVVGVHACLYALPQGPARGQMSDGGDGMTDD